MATSPLASLPVRFLVPSLLISCLVLGCGVKPKEEDKPPPHPVDFTALGQVKLWEWTELLGTVQPLPDKGARVSAPVEGRVIAVLPGLTEGMQVEKGAVLVQLDASIAQSNVEKTNALRDALEQEDKRAKSALTLAEMKYASVKDVQTIPKLQKEEARLGVEDAKSAVIAAAKRLQAGVEEAKAAADQLQFYSLKAPLSGRLDRILVTLGQTIPSGTVVAEIVDVEKEVDVLCFVPLGTAQRLAKGKGAWLGGVQRKSDTLNPRRPEGRIEFIAERADPDTGSFAVKVRFLITDSVSKELRPNTVQRLLILTRQKIGRSIPETALLEDTDPPNVIIAEDEVVRKDKDGKEETVYTARKLVATIGMRDRLNGMVEITDLTDPDKKWKGHLDDGKGRFFVTAKNQGLQTGDTLKKEEEPPEEEGK